MNTLTDAVRYCPQCDTTKPVAEFARHTVRGHQHWCRACMTEERARWRARIKTQEPHKYSMQKLADALRKRKARNLARLATLKAARALAAGAAHRAQQAKWHGRMVRKAVTAGAKVTQADAQRIAGELTDALDDTPGDTQADVEATKQTA